VLHADGTAQITYISRSDVNGEDELNVLASVYRFVLLKKRENAASHPSVTTGVRGAAAKKKGL
jgi:hypothetical protein